MPVYSLQLKNGSSIHDSGALQILQQKPWIKLYISAQAPKGIQLTQFVTILLMRRQSTLQHVDL